MFLYDLIVSLVALYEAVHPVQFLGQLIAVFHIRSKKQVRQRKQFLLVVLGNKGIGHFTHQQHHLIIIRIIPHHRYKGRIVMRPEHIYSQCIAHRPHIYDIACRPRQTAEI